MSLIFPNPEEDSGDREGRREREEKLLLLSNYPY